MSHKNNYASVDLFAGCGGLSLGFMLAGFNLVASYDNWAPAIETHRSNLAHPVHEFDLTNISETTKHITKHYDPDVILGGPPCQDFSLANNKKSTTRANLTIQFAKIIANIKPTMFVMENVCTIRRSEHLSKAISIFKQAGYGLTQRVIDASRVGVPQMRQRFFLIGYRFKEDDFFGEALDHGLSDKRTTVRDHLGEQLDFDHYYTHPRSYKRRAIFSVDEPAATIRRVNRPIPSTYKLHPADKCAVTKDLRNLSTEERALLQTFPRSFKFAGTNSQKEQQIGNAVPILLGKYVGLCIRKVLEKNPNEMRFKLDEVLVE